MGKKKAKGNNVNKTGQGPVLSVPSVDVSVKCRNVVSRYEVNATLTNFNLVARAVIGSLLVKAVTTTTAWSSLWAIKIKKIIFYGPANAASATSALSFEWVNTGQDYATEPSSITGGSVGTSFGSKLTAVPPADSIWSKWISLVSPGNVTMAVFSVPSGTTVEVVYDCYLENADTSPIQFTGLTALTIGSNYRLGLDGQPLVTTQFNVLGFARA